MTRIIRFSHQTLDLSVRGLLAVVIVPLAAACAHSGPRGTLPAQLSDEAFWRLTTDLSEPPGTFRHSDNLVSNEALFAQTIRLLRPAGGVYIGVGPEQNFSYIARLQPAMAFIVDIRQENRGLHLFYKALFELSETRADFVSRLFARERPPGLDEDATPYELFAAVSAAPPSSALFESTGRLVRARLLDLHRFPLSAGELDAIDYARHAFFTDGPDIHYARTRAGSPPGPSYRALMTATDIGRTPRSYLASEEAFRGVKDLHAANLIVPVVGDFAGPGAIRRIGDYARAHGALVTAFYASNVEIYLLKHQAAAFCASLASLPAAPRAWFIGNKGVQRVEDKLMGCGRS